jgi:hypothetical protein
MCPTVRATRTIEWTVAVTNAKCAVKETQEDSRVVFIAEGLPEEMKPANYGRTTAFRPDVLTMGRVPTWLLVAIMAVLSAILLGLRLG